MEETKPFAPFFTVSQRDGTEGAEYVLTLVNDDGTWEQRSLGDAQEDYWTLANLIDKTFG